MTRVIFTLSLLTAVIFGSEASAEPLRIKTEHPRAEFGTWRWFADLLTGIEATLFTGTARLSSSVRPEVGPAFRLASAEVAYGGWSVSLLDAPRKTGIGLGADFGYFLQNASVAGFQQSLPRPQASTDVAGVCTTEGGEGVDCSEPNRYDLKLWSAYIGPEVFAALVAGNPRVELFAMLSGAFRGFEYRSIETTIGRGTVAKRGPALFRSATTGVTVGMTLPKLHASVRVAVDFEHYFRFRYPEPLEFQGPVTYDDERDIWLRPRMWVDDTQIDALALSASAGVLF